MQSLEQVIKNMYENYIDYIRKDNADKEFEYFLENDKNIPYGYILERESFESIFGMYASAVKSETSGRYQYENIFDMLESYFLFSAGHDMLFKTKLKADEYESVPLKSLFLPRVSKAIREKYNDVSVMKKNPNFDANVIGIKTIFRNYLDLQTLLYLFYCSDCSFPFNWEMMFPTNAEEVRKILMNSGIKVGELLDAIIDYKGQIMQGIFSGLPDECLRKEYLDRVEKLCAEKHAEVSQFSHVNMPIAYFMDHDYYDFWNLPSSILAEEPKGSEKDIILPRR